MSLMRHQQQVLSEMVTVVGSCDDRKNMRDFPDGSTRSVWKNLQKKFSKHSKAIDIARGCRYWPVWTKRMMAEQSSRNIDSTRVQDTRALLEVTSDLLKPGYRSRNGGGAQRPVEDFAGCLVLTGFE
ncbi:hypothetical protein ACJRO7_010745 [Eucalyptus globulus]|uniref:Uncharacterized protein n=1 Tax=Eucalyptus globulus TaxID=34317 RepID=A0ABD3LIG9_EUCGL